MVKRVLFVCSQNLLRSPTAEQVFADHPEVECLSAGTNSDAQTPLSLELVQWADVIAVMEPVHRRKLALRFGAYLRDKRVVCLDIPDRYTYMDPALVRLLEAKVPRLLSIARRPPGRSS
jgi:predicted protein tyrosine phosphatase